MRFILPDKENATFCRGALPERFSCYELPHAAIFRTTGDFGTIISQLIDGPNFAIWKHDFLIDRPVPLYPYVAEGTYTINYMLKGDIPCELVDVGKVVLREQTYNLYYVPPVKQYAWLEAGQYACLHIDLSLDYLHELAGEFAPLQDFLECSMAGQAKIVRPTHYRIDGNINMILKDIMGYMGWGATRNIYMRCRIYDLLLIFSRDLSAEVDTVFGVDEILLGEILAFIAENYHMPITINWLCRHFGISGTSLKEKFKAQFGITVHRFVTKQRMEASVLLLDQNMPVSNLARAVGYSDTASFTKAFTAFYKCSPTVYISRQQEGR